jgi:hypothetical protein
VPVRQSRHRQHQPGVAAVLAHEAAITMPKRSAARVVSMAAAIENAGELY